MKNKLILLIIFLFTTGSGAFAVQEGKVISDSATKNEVMDAFGSVNPYSNNFFTPYIEKTKKVDEDISEQKRKQHGSVPPVKKLRLMLMDRGKPKQKVIEDTTAKDQAVLDCDAMEYFAERTELEANGHVVMFFPQNNSTMKADKVIYNQSSNLIKAFGHVILINDGKELNGDYMQIDMNEENALMDNPTTSILQIRAKAKTGYMYGDKIIQEQGSMYVTKKTMINLKAEVFGPDIDRMLIPEKDKGYYSKDSHGEKFRIKTTDLIINAKDEHDTVTLNHAEIYFNGKKVGTIPSITMHTNKAQDYLEANFPEIGTTTNMGFYAGPGFVFDTPKGTTLKVVPVINYQGNSDNGNSFGFGGIGKFKSATNKTDMMYGTANKVFIMRGLQKLDDNLYFQYGTNAYMDDWFLGFRMPKLLGELVFQDTYPQRDFIGKGKDMFFTQRVAAAYAQDGDPSTGFFDNNSGVGTMRFKYMAEAAQTLFKLGDEQKNPINARFDIIGQGSAAVYGTGDTQFIARIGPRVHTQYKHWMQDIGYFLSAYNDNTPLVTYDKYMYGRSNVYLQETYRVCKYLTASWLGSFNMLQDSWDGKMIQENMFFVSIGPDDVKLNIGYDTVRQQSFVTMAMNLDAKGSTIEYKKMVIKNPETLGKKKNGDNQKQTFSPNSEEDGAPERAEVIDVNEAL